MSDFGYDLYVLAEGVWSLHNSYEEEEEDSAMQDAVDLKTTSGYKAIYLFYNKNGRTVYHYDATGKKMRYGEVLKAAESGKKQRMSPGARAPLGRPKPKINIPVRKSAPEPEIKDPTAQPLIVAIGGVMTAGVVFMVMGALGVHPSIAMGAMVIVLMGAGLFAFNLYQQILQENEKEKAAAEKAANLLKVENTLQSFVNEAKKLCWDKEEKKMHGDTPLGTMLYLSGASTELCAHFRLEEEEVRPLMQGVVAMARIGVTNIQNFFNNMEEYKLYPRYADMMEAGTIGVKVKLEKSVGDAGLGEAFKRWIGQDASSQEKPPEVAAVLFTDIVSFTASVNANGHEWMVDVLKAHNEIVRTVLDNFGGREVKHTGDGIMASFPVGIDAVNAAMMMQRSFDFFRQNMPGRAFRVRIGIGAGEPVHIDGDLFGAPVNLAARVIAQADSDEICLSELTAKMCPAEYYKFAEIPNCSLKGFEGAHTVYRLLWAESSVPESRPSPANLARLARTMGPMRATSEALAAEEALTLDLAEESAG